MHILYVGYAGSRARFGIRGKLIDHFSDRELNPEIRGKAKFFRYEVSSSYLSRWVEVTARHHQAGGVPWANAYSKEYPRHMPFFGPGSPRNCRIAHEPGWRTNGLVPDQTDEN